MKCPLCEQKVPKNQVVDYMDEQQNRYKLCGPCAYYEEITTNEVLKLKIEDLKKALRLVLGE
jgi:hypothetical protein